MDSAIQVAMIGLFAAVAGGILQATFASRHEAAKFQREAKKEIYSNFVSALCAQGTSAPGTAAHAAATASMLEAKAKIMLYGSQLVVDNFAIISTYPNLTPPPAKQAMAEAIKEMRRDVGEPFDYRFARQVQEILF